jgi:hypothetical protein
MSTALALINLRPNSQFRWEGENYSDIQWFDETIAKPTEQEIIDESNRIKAEYVSNEYQRKRAAEYPSFAEQFDTLYHGGYDAWKATIDSVKTKYPKP